MSAPQSGNKVNVLPMQDKYERMVKNGVPVGAVEQMMNVDYG